MFVLFLLILFVLLFGFVREMAMLALHQCLVFVDG